MLEYKDRFNESSPFFSEVALKTGLDTVFTEDALYNSINPLTGGNLILNGAGAKNGKAVWQYFARHIPEIETPNEEKYEISGKTPSVNKLNIYKMVFNGSSFGVVVDQKSYIATPSPIISLNSDELTISEFGVINAENYSIKINTTNDKPSATEIYNGNGTDLTTDFEFVYSGLTIGVTYYLFIDATGNAFLDSLTNSKTIIKIQI